MEKRYNHTEQERAQRTFWHEQNIYKTAPTSNARLYAVDTPPPTVSGALHIGHIFSYTQTDIIARFKRMSGYHIFYPFGFDDNGLATERYIEKKCKIRAQDLGRTAFIQRCLEETAEAEEQFKNLWQAMGLSVDWDYSYTTISGSVRKISQASFIDLYNKGHIYRKLEPALYCTTCRTSVAQAELDDLQRESIFYTISFKDQQNNDLYISTTRPELLSSCVALFFHPDDARYKHLIDQKAMVPLFGYHVPILTDSQVDPAKGTGLVMCCTFGDTTDIHWYKTYQLPYRQSIDLRGTWKSDTGILAGLTVTAARQTVVQALRDHGALHGEKPILQNVNVHERCKNPIEYIMLWQWFLRLLDHKETFLQIADRIDWYPAFMKTRYLNWVEHLDWDWCLSRQRYYGIPFPAWHCAHCNETILASIDELPIDPQETEKRCARCNNVTHPDTDVMDTWNTSSLTPYICQQLYTQKDVVFGTKSSFLPMAMRPQAHDIIRTWAFYTIVKTWLHEQQIPWNHIVISGHVLSEKQEKISKSQEHKALSPEHLLSHYPADAIRYWTAATTLGYDTPFSSEQIKNGQRLITKLWNAFLFIKEHSQKSTTDYMPTTLINQWIIEQAHECTKQYQHAFDQHEFGTALHIVENFFWKLFCDNYIEIVKDQLFKPEKYPSHDVAETRATLYHIGFYILQWYAPYMPHVTEAIYQAFYQLAFGTRSIHHTQFGSIQIADASKQASAAMQAVLYVLSSMRKLKSSQQLALNTPIQILTIYTDSAQTVIKDQEQLLKGVTHAQQIICMPSNTMATRIEQQNGVWNAHIVCEI